MARPTKFPTWATNNNFPAGGNPWSGTASRVDPGAGKQLEGWDPAEQPSAQVTNWLFGMTGDWLQYLDALGGGFMFGDGNDGSLTLDGVVAAPSGMSKVGTVYTLTRDQWLINLTVTGAGVILKTNGFKLFGQGTLTTAAGGTITNNGADASGLTAGAAAGSATATLGFGSAGGNGGAGGGGVGSNGGNTGGLGVSYSGLGGNAAAATGGGGGAGGVSGTQTAPTGTTTPPRVADAQLGTVFDRAATAYAMLLGGTGGGGGGGGANGGSTGGGGGGGGGVILIAFRYLALSAAGDITCKGGSGGIAIVGAGFTGGSGGGGGGGTLFLVYLSKSTGLTFSAATNCTGGAAPGANPGNPGSNGTVFDLGASAGTAVGTPGSSHVERGMIVCDGVADTFTATFAIGFNTPVTGVGSYRVDDLSVYSADGTLIDANVVNKALSVDGGGKPLSMRIKCQSVPAVNSEIYWQASQ